MGSIRFLVRWINPFTADPRERQSARVSKIKNGGLDQYGAETFKQQQFGTGGIEGAKRHLDHILVSLCSVLRG